MAVEIKIGDRVAWVNLFKTRWQTFWKLRLMEKHTM